MKKIAIFVLILFGFLSWSDFAVAEENYRIKSFSSEFRQFGAEKPGENPNKCSIENFCLCNLQLNTNDTFNKNEVPGGGGAYAGVFKSGGKLYDYRVMYNGSWRDYEINLDMSNNGCNVVKKYVGFTTGAGEEKDTPYFPNLSCIFNLGKGQGCCCTQDKDGSMSCEITPKDQATCTLQCTVPAVGYEAGPDGSCASYERKAYRSDATIDVLDVDTLKTKAAGLNKLSSLGTGASGVNTFIGKIINFLMYIIGSLLLLFYVYAGFLWMTASGNSEQIGKAKTIIMWATLSIVVQFSAYWLVKNLFSLFGS